MHIIRPLIINRYYQASHSPVGECLRAFVEAMPNDCWQPMVYTSDRKPLLDRIPDYVSFVHEDRWVQYFAAAVRRLVLPDLTWLPDYEWRAWGKRTVKKILRDIDCCRIQPDYIHSVSYPVASHWAALKIKQTTGLPWVMQFYDPWADNPYRPFKTKFFKDKDWEMERIAAEQADLIIHDNEVIAEAWRTRYGPEIGKKVVVLPLSVPLPKTEPQPVTASGRLIVTHIGNFMLNRTAEPFIMAIDTLMQRHPDVRDRVEVHFIGSVKEEDKKLIKKKALDDLFNIHGIMSAEECEKYYQQSNLFLAIDGVNPDNLFFPSKILKYFYFRRPVLGITPIGSVLERELRNSNHTVFSNNDTESIASFLYRAITDYPSILTFDYSYWHRFEPESVVSTYQSWIEDLVSKRSY